MPCLFQEHGLAYNRGEKKQGQYWTTALTSKANCAICVCVNVGVGMCLRTQIRFCNSLHNKCNIHRLRELPVTAQHPLPSIPISDAPEWAPLLPWTVWDIFCPGEKQWCWMTYQSLSTPTPSTESLLFFGIDNLLYQGFHLLLIPSFPSYHRFPPMGCSFPRNLIHTAPSVRSSHYPSLRPYALNQTPYVRKGSTRLHRWT